MITLYGHNIATSGRTSTNASYFIRQCLKIIGTKENIGKQVQLDHCSHINSAGHYCGINTMEILNK